MGWFEEIEHGEPLQVNGSFPGDIAMKTVNDANLPKQTARAVKPFKQAPQTHEKGTKPIKT